MEALIKQRTIEKSKITRLETWFNNNKDCEVEIIQFKTRQTMLIKAFEKYNSIQDEIEILDDKECDDRNFLEDRYITVLTNYQKKIDSFPGSNVEQNTGSMSQIPSISRINKPQLNIPEFSGDITLWTSFFELFENLIITDSSLTDIEKLIYLKSYLKGEPLRLISNLQLTSANFNVAVRSLKDRYENQLNIIYAYIKNLLEVPSLSKGSATQLRDFITFLKQNLDGLKILHVNVDDWNLLLVYIFSQKLDTSTKRAFDFELSPHDRPTLDLFLNFLEKRCVILERQIIPDLNVNQKGTYTKRISHQVHLSQKSSTANNNRSKVSSHIKGKCLYCNLNNHTIYQCFKFSGLVHEDKIQFVKNYKLCFNCLAYNHGMKECSSRGCSICHRFHHTLLHNDQQSSNTPGSYRNRNSKLSSPDSLHTSVPHFQDTSGQISSKSNHHCTNSNTNISDNSHSNYLQQPSTSRSQNNHNKFKSTSHNDFTSQNDGITLSVSSSSGEVLLATALVTMYTKFNEPIQVKAVLDPCSTTSIVTEDIVRKLGCTSVSRNIQISGINGTVASSSKLVNIIIHSNTRKNTKFNICCSVLKKITQRLPQYYLRKDKIFIPSNIQLADPNFNIPSNIDLLLGADVYYNLINGGIIKIQKNCLTLVDTKLGYIIGGPIPQEIISYVPYHNTDITSNSCYLLQSSSLTETIQKFWEIEEIHNKGKILSPEEELAENIYLQTTKVLEDGSFQVDLPFKSPNEYLKLGQSFSLAKIRFFHLEKRFEKYPELFKEYKSFIDEYVALKHAKYVPLNIQNDYQENKYFIPHHCVIKEESVSTKLRVVFDASMKTTSRVSLNDIMLKGFTVQPELIDILCRFRLHKFVLTCDIQKMYRMIKINPTQTFLQNILWRENPSEPLKCLELQTISYGTNSAPFLATRTLNELAIRNKKRFPLAADIILSQCYVDDILFGSNSMKTLEKSCKQLMQLLNSANFSLHKWQCNNSQFISSVAKDNSHDIKEIKIENNSSKVLGISWDSNSDQFSVTLPKCISKEAVTKRTILSHIAQMFDPLGLISPVIVIAKIIMQQIWLSKVDWDEILDSDITPQWKKFMENIPQLNQVKIARNLFTSDNIHKIEIHGFCDASLKAYGAVAYLRTIYIDNQVSCMLIASKSRIAPLKTISLPRLELCGALLLSQLVKKIIDIFENKISISRVNLWTDSEIVLCWIKAHPSKWSTFVANRVSEIQQLSFSYFWNHVKSEDNPADFISRGLTPQEIVHNSVWWHGPQFLKQHDLDFTQINTFTIKLDNIPEERKVKPVLHNIHFDHCLNFCIKLFSKFSSIIKLKRVISYCLRFINNMRPNSIKRYGCLTVVELQNAELFIIKTIQKQCFPKEILQIKENKVITNKSILQLTPFIDNMDVVRVGGRLAYSNLSYCQKYPILLPSKCHITILILRYEHIRLGHAGVQTTLSNVRLKYWPLHGTVELKRIIRNCVTCHRFKVKNSEQLMANLPSCRLIPSRPFSKVGVDFGGPFFIKASMNRKATLVKCYIAVFVCMVCKAVHIEAVSDLTTASFILALKRFISRRGNPLVIFSDNATNFVGARNQLRALYDFFKYKRNTESIIQFLSNEEIQWKFIPPMSPHWGGIWEAAIKSAKYHLCRIVGNAHFNFEEFSTILAQIEAILNSRPLKPLSSDSNDMSCLTPGHFLIGNSLKSFPEVDISSKTENRLTRFERCTQVQQLFWKRWVKEYLNQLQNRPKWFTPYPDLTVNDIVLIKEESSRPLEWPLARIIEIIPSKDTKIRLVKVQTKNGTFIRNISKICPLPK